MYHKIIKYLATHKLSIFGAFLFGLVFNMNSGQILVLDQKDL